MVSGVALLAQHRGTPPDLIIRWNSMAKRPSAVDVVVHLHGYSGNQERMRLDRDKEPNSGLDFGDPNVPGASGGGTRPTLAILPRGNYFGGKSKMGYNFPALITADGVRQLIKLGLELFAQAIGSSEPTMSRLILTAHSGGGAALVALLRHGGGRRVVGLQPCREDDPEGRRGKRRHSTLIGEIMDPPGVWRPGETIADNAGFERDIGACPGEPQPGPMEQPTNGDEEGNRGGHPRQPGAATDAGPRDVRRIRALL